MSARDLRSLACEIGDYFRTPDFTPRGNPDTNEWAIDWVEDTIKPWLEAHDAAQAAEITRLTSERDGQVTELRTSRRSFASAARDLRAAEAEVAHLTSELAEADATGAGLVTKANKLATRVARLTEANGYWMNGVADAVEPFGFDRDAACGPADLLPGLEMLTERVDRLTEALRELHRLGRTSSCEWMVRYQGGTELHDRVAAPLAGSNPAPSMQDSPAGASPVQETER